MSRFFRGSRTKQNFHDRDQFVRGHRQDYYEYDQQRPDQYQAPSRPVRKPPSSRGRDTTRQDKFREDVGRVKARELQEQLDKDLFFGFSFDSKAMEGQRVTVVPQAKVVSVSTRGIGFAAQSVYTRLMRTLRNLPPCTIYQLYRVALAQFELKLLRSMRNNYLPYNCDRAQFRQIFLTNDVVELLLGMPINFNLIANIINALGIVIHGDVTYYPRLPALEVNPCAVSLSNLRATVQALHNPQHDRHVRTVFYENNPIPGAIWDGINPEVGARRRAEFQINPVLRNPDDIMPEVYNGVDLQRDIAAVQDLLNACVRKKVKYVNLDVKLDYDGPGQRTLLVSNKMRGDLKIEQPALIDDRNIDWQRTDLPAGTLDEFWSSVPLEPNAMFIGALQLLGEVPFPTPPEPGVFTSRLEETAAMRFSHLWTAIYTNMVG